MVDLKVRNSYTNGLRIYFVTVKHGHMGWQMSVSASHFKSDASDNSTLFLSGGNCFTADLDASRHNGTTASKISFVRHLIVSVLPT